MEGEEQGQSPVTLPRSSPREADSHEASAPPGAEEASPVAEEEQEDPAIAERRKKVELIAQLWREAPNSEASCAVIFLHGHAETEVAWQFALKSVEAPEEAGPCRWLWPRSEPSSCTALGGVHTTQWFDVPELPICRVVRAVPDRKRIEEDPQQIGAAVDRIHLMIEGLEEEGLRADKVVLAGFGQGAALALHCAWRYPRRLAGCAMMAGWVPCWEVLHDTMTEEGSKTDVLWMHGARDRVVEPQLAAEQAKALKAEGLPLVFRLFPEMGYAAGSENFGVFQSWLVARLTADPTAAAVYEGAPLTE